MLTLLKEKKDAKACDGTILATSFILLFTGNIDYNN